MRAMRGLLVLLALAVTVHATAPVQHADNGTATPIQPHQHTSVQEPQLHGLPEPESSAHSKHFPSFEFDRMPYPDASRLLFDSPCNTCKHIVSEVAETASKTGVNEYGVVLATQWMCIQQELAAGLDLQCSSWERVENWLLQGGLITRRRPMPAFDPKPIVQYSSFASDPVPFCTKVNLCGAGAKQLMDSALYTGGNSSAVTVRFKFLINLGLPLSSPEWRNFVKIFLRDVAESLSIQPSRLQLHVHKGDPLAEVLILRNGGNGDRDIGYPQYRTALQLGLDLRNIMSGKAQFFAARGRVKALVDPSYEVEVFALKIPKKGLEKWDLLG